MDGYQPKQKDKIDFKDLVPPKSGTGIVTPVKKIEIMIRDNREVPRIPITDPIHSQR